jgi:quercetin dioxygenase-like cupin family protein
MAMGLDSGKGKESTEMRSMKGRWARLVIVGAAVGAVLTGVALATPPSGILSGTIVARAAFSEPVDVKFKIGPDEVIHVREARDTVMQRIVIGPGGYTGWHSHPGPAVALVMAGELTLYSGDDPTCTGQSYPAGQAFVDAGQGHVHMARNLSPTENVEVWVTYLDVPPGGSVRVDAADPGVCGF